MKNAQRTYNGLTAKEIIEGRDGETRGGDCMTGDIVWNFRTSQNPDGTVKDFGEVTVCKRENADCITIEDVKHGIEAVLDIRGEA